MKVALIPRVGEDIGLGHLQRCVTLARALHGSGHRPAIIIESPLGGPHDAIRALVPEGIECARTIEEAFDLRGDIEDASSNHLRRIDWAVVDDYAADATSDVAWRRWAANVLVLDDHASSARDADVLLAQALTREPNDFVGLVPESCRVLTGPRFALVRSEFGSRVWASLPDGARSRIRSVFVSMGGTDAGNSLDRVLRALAGLAVEGGLVVHVMISTLSRTTGRLHGLVERLPYKCVVHRDVRDPVALMVGCDAAVTAGGMTSFELATLGVPVVIIPSTPLEAEVARVLAQHAVAHVLDADDADDANWQSELLRTLGSFERGRSAPTHRIFDGGGAERVVRVMESWTEKPDHE